MATVDALSQWRRRDWGGEGRPAHAPPQRAAPRAPPRAQRTVLQGGPAHSYLTPLCTRPLPSYPHCSYWLQRWLVSPQVCHSYWCFLTFMKRSLETFFYIYHDWQVRHYPYSFPALLYSPFTLFPGLFWKTTMTFTSVLMSVGSDSADFLLNLHHSSNKKQSLETFLLNFSWQIIKHYATICHKYSR